MTTLFAPQCPPRPRKHALRDYQRRAVNSIGQRLAEDGSTLLVMATGLGKTVCFAHAIKEHCKGRALVLAHRRELIEQNARTIESVVGEPCAIEMAERHADLSWSKRRVVVASKDTLHPKRIAKFDPSEFGLLVTDESHHAVASSYERIYEHFAGVPHLGVTATPNRHDEAALGRIYASVAMIYGIADGIRDGWLVPIVARTPIVTDLRLDDVRTVAGDLNQAELAEQMEQKRPVHEVCATTTEMCGDRRGIVFAASVRQAAMLADSLNRYEPGCAMMVSGETPQEERDAIIAAHKRGDFRFLCNCNVLTEGYDDPGVGAIVMARPTKSLALFTQMVGRGTRALPGVIDDVDSVDGRTDAIAASAKPNMLLLNFTGNCSRHKLVTPADVLGGKYAEDDVRAAARMMESEPIDVRDALERARSDRERKASGVEREYADSHARIVAMAKYLVREEDLFDADFSPERERTWAYGKPPTNPQIQTLEKAGFRREDIERMSRVECSRLIGEIITRRMRGLCTIKQARALERRGFKNAASMSFEEAGAHLDRLYGGLP